MSRKIERVLHDPISLGSRTTDHTFHKFHLYSIYIAWSVILGLALFGGARVFLIEYHDLVLLGRSLGVW
ncbi:MAG: hypothetical protein ACLPXM_01205 [Terriglobales bacterium]